MAAVLDTTLAPLCARVYKVDHLASSTDDVAREMKAMCNEGISFRVMAFPKVIAHSQPTPKVMHEP